MLCGTEPFPQNVRAKKYKIHQHFLDKKNFHHMMTNLPEKVRKGRWSSKQFISNVYLLIGQWGRYWRNV